MTTPFIYFMGIILSVASFAFFYLMPAYRQVKSKRENADKTHDEEAVLQISSKTESRSF